MEMPYKEPKNPLRELAAEVYQEKGLEGVDHLARLIQNDEDLWERAIRQAAYDLLRYAQQTLRQELNQEAREDFVPKKYPPGSQERAERMVLSLMDWPLPKGQKLGDATKTEILEGAEDYEAKASGCLSNARFLRLVAGRLQEGETPRGRLSIQELTILRRKADKKK